MTSAKAFIEGIKERQLKSDQEFVLDSLTGAIDRLQKAFPRYGSFIMEFIQNADDAESTSMQIEILPEKIRISNNGDPFTDDNVKSICKVGRSSKTPKDYIGYLGVGFKSVFLISDSPSIYSAKYKFKFSKTAWTDPSHIPWQIIPLWIEDSAVSFDGKFTTLFDIPIKEAAMLEMLRSEVTDEHLNRRILLFLRNITEIEIIDRVQGVTRKIGKKSVRTVDDYAVYQVQEYENDTLKSEDNWLVIRSVSDVPEKVRVDYVTKEWERDHIDKREVSAAFRLSHEDNLESEQQGTAHIGVFSFLPLKEIPSGLNFMIQADFLTNPGRGDLARQCQWNNWLAGEVYKLIESKCIGLFLQDDHWKMNFTKVLYPAEGGHELFDVYIKKPLRTYLENSAVLIAEDGTATKPQELVKIGNEVRDLLLSDDISVLYPSKKVMHQKCDYPYNLKVKIGASEASSLLWEDEIAELLLQKTLEKDIEWFKSFYTKINDSNQLSVFRDKHYRYNVEYEKFWNGLRESQKQFLVTENYELARPAEAYINPNKIRIPDEIKKNMKILHADILKDDKTKAFIDRLAIRLVTDDEVKEVVKRHEAIKLDADKWQTLSEEVRFESTKHLKELWVKGKKFINVDDYKFITLKSKAGEWFEPDSLIFPKKYMPDHELEVLAGEGLIDLPLNYVSETYVEGASNEEIRRWKEFLKVLGVDTYVEKNKKEGGRKEDVVQRVGVLLSLNHEKKQNRNPRELGESEKPGYDILSEANNQAWFIEVKSTSKQSSFDIFLTVHELSALRNFSDKYAIYAVTNALRSPQLHVLRGDTLLKLIEKEIKITIPYNLWHKHVEHSVE
jgi:hypothetical protein